MAVQNICKALIIYGYFIVSQSSLRWDIKTTTVIYGQDATLSCNGNGCMPISIRKWIGGPIDDVLCFNDYSSNPAKYQLMYNKSKPSFDLMIKRFNFTDANCSYTCACGFLQYTNMLQMHEIDFVYPPDKDLSTEIRQADGKLYIHMSMKVHPLPHCTINIGNIVLPVKTKVFDVQEEIGIILYLIKIEYIVDIDYKNCRENLTLSCEVRTYEFPLLQQELALCKDHPDAEHGTLIWILPVFVCGLIMVALMVIYGWKRKKKLDNDQNVAYEKRLVKIEKSDEPLRRNSAERDDCSTTSSNNEDTVFHTASTVEYQ